LSHLKVSWAPVKALELSTSFGYHLQTVNDFYGIPTTVLGSGYATRADYSTNTIQTFIAEPQVFYRLDLKRKGKISALLGTTYQKSLNSFQNLNGSGFSNDALLGNPAAAAMLIMDRYQHATYKYLGTFSRLSYNLDNKYLLNVTGRVDGTSRFGPGKQYHPFGAVGVAWILSEEKFMKKVAWINFAKLRGSYGVIGNSNIEDHQFLDSYIPYSPPMVDYQNVQPFVPNRLYNPDLGWELKKSVELALELQLFKNRLGLSVSAYRNRNSQQLLLNTISTVTGFNSVFENSGATVENKGIEMVLYGTLISRGSFSWNLDANVSFQKNRLLHYNGLDNQSYNLVVGQSISSVKVYQYGGVDPERGTFFFVDRNGQSSTSLTEQDKTQFINTDPSSYGGLSNSFVLKGLSLDVMCMFVVRNGKNDFGQMGILPAGFTANQIIDVLSRWQNPGDITNVPRFTRSDSAFRLQDYAVNSTAAFGDASFLRVRNVSISYSFNKSLLERMHLQSLRLYVRGQNLFTFSKFAHVDPENVQSYFASMPPLRVITGGVQIVF
jgi:hypothetical protein